MAENRELALVLKLVADQFQSQLKKSGGMLGEFNQFISNWKVQLTAAAGALFAVAKSTANYGEDLLKTSQKIGINVEALAGLQHAAHLADLSQDQLAQGLKFLSVNMAEAARHAGDGEALFHRLGVAATTATGQLRPTEEVLLDLAEVFAQSKDGAGKAEAAVKLFGRAGLELIPFLNQGKAGIKGLMDEARRLGLVLSQEDAEAANRFNDELKKITAGVRGLTLALGKELIPVLTELMEGFRTLSSSGAAQFFFKGLAEQAVLFSTVVKEAAANVQFLFGKLTFDQLRTEIKRLEAEASAKLLLLENPEAAKFVNGPATPEKGPAEEKKELSVGVNPELAAQLTADQQRRAQAIEDRLALVKAGFAREQVMIETGLAAGATLETDAAQARLTLREQELDAEGAALIAQKEATVRFHADRLALGFKDAAERLKIHTDYHKSLAEIDQKIALNAAQTATAILQGQNEIDQATAATIRQQNELLFAGATALKADREQQQQFQIDNAQAWVAYYDQLGGNTEDFLAHKTELLRAQLAKELDLTTEQSAALLEAWQQRDSLRADQILANSPRTSLELETIELNTHRQALLNAREASSDFFAGWTEGMRKYVKDTQSGFGLAADMARRTAALMEQGFRTFFFDVMEGHITSLKDVLRSLLDFAKQIIAQITAQLVTNKLVGAVVGAFSGPVGGGIGTPSSGSAQIGAALKPAAGGQVVRRFALGGEVLQRFAFGGPVQGQGNQDTVPALLTPGEFVLSRKDVGDIKSGLGGGDVTVVVNNYGNNDVQAQSSGRGGDGRQMIYITVRDLVQGMVQGGEMDAPFSRRFGLTPSPGRR